jgi:hypothetical protein
MSETILAVCAVVCTLGYTARVFMGVHYDRIAKGWYQASTRRERFDNDIRDYVGSDLAKNRVQLMALREVLDAEIRIKELKYRKDQNND